MAQGITADAQAMVDWVTQPSPSFMGDAHGLYFFLVDLRNPPPFFVYQGFLFFRREPNPGFSRHHRLMGVARIVGNIGYRLRAQTTFAGTGDQIVTFPPEWVRLDIVFNFSTSTGEPRPQGVSLSFFEDNDGRLGEQAFTLEYDTNVAFSSGPPPGAFARLQHSETHADEFNFTIRATNLMYPG